MHGVSVSEMNLERAIYSMETIKNRLSRVLDFILKYLPRFLFFYPVDVASPRSVTEFLLFPFYLHTLIHMHWVGETRDYWRRVQNFQMY